MKITKLELKNFKRFDDLTIDLTSLAEPAKLVLLIGTNGSGKSSVFDAFEILNKINGSVIFKRSDLYYRKEKGYDFEIDLIGEFKDPSGKTVSHISTSHHNTFIKSPFYGRTSFRQTPKLTRTASGQVYVNFHLDSDRPDTFIDHDNRFENDIEKVSSSILTDLFGKNSTQEILETYINPINRALENVFGAEDNLGIKLLSIKPPLDGKIAEILFEKGNSNIPYDFLSSGEKEIFNILLDLLVRKEYFQDSVYFLDEIDLHLNTYLQKNLLKEITQNWIPENCQLWTASHSLGFIEYANETDNAAIIDFDNLNFDVPQVITPSPKNNFDVFEIAVSKEFLANLFEGKRIVFSENTDTTLYNNLSIDDTVFFNAKDKSDVFYKSKNNEAYNGLIDRDYLTDEERLELLQVYKNLFILNYYSIENYLFHPDNLKEYYSGIERDFDKNKYINLTLNERAVVRDKILIGLLGARSGYQFYRGNKNDPKLEVFKSNGLAIMQMFDSSDFETFYKVFPAKTCGTEIKERQNLSKIDLAKTVWFKAKIEEVLKK
jgi:energy-coupling factor transporter ATP-binding protein EcfA2